ncbi:MAG: DUF4349 domain-containing protein [Caldilineaceae bacterium]
MFTQKRITQLMILVLLWALFLLSGCAAAPMAAPSSGGGSAAEAVAPAAPAEQTAKVNAVAQAGAADNAGFQRKIIGKASITLVVQDTQKAVDGINSLMTQVNGYVANANLYKSEHDGGAILEGTLTLRMPADQMDRAMKQLEGLALTVGSKNLSREDVTDQYTDVDAQLRNLTATETELRALLAEVRAKPDAKPDDILTVHQRITEIRGQIDQLQGRKNVLDNLISLATIDVTLTPDVLTQPVVEAGWRPSAVVHSAVRTLVSTLQIVGTAAIWVAIYLLPLALIALVVFGGFFWGLRLLFRRVSNRNRLASA